MLVSVKHNFVLLAMPKCGSTALHSALTPYAELRIGSLPALKHAPLKSFEKYILPFLVEVCRDQQTFEPFSLFREPIEWLFSWYSYRGRKEMGEASNYAGHVSFHDFLHEHFQKKPAAFARLRRQSFLHKKQQGSIRFRDSLSLRRHRFPRAGIIAEGPKKLVPIAGKRFSEEKNGVDGPPNWRSQGCAQKRICDLFFYRKKRFRLNLRAVAFEPDLVRHVA